MKSRSVLLFILSAFAALALLCRFFPEEGIKLGPLTLDFPSLGEILTGDEPEGEDPEELLARRLEAIREARKSDFLQYFSDNPARIYFPGDSIGYLDSFFESLDSAASRRMRIVHYGDSQIEEDRISKVLRDSLQTRFGGGGPGLLPVLDEYYNLSISEASSATPRRYLAYGPPEMRGAAGRYGVMARKSHFDTTAVTTFFPVKSNKGPSRYFNRLTFLSSGGDVTIRCKDSTQRVEATSDIRHIRFVLPDSTERVSITHSGSHDVYGVMLDGEAGVALDNIPMRGCGGTIFTGIRAEQLADYYNTENVRLIILQYGGNVIPYTKKEDKVSEYCRSISRQIEYLQELAPRARILFIGPSDMSTNIQGKMQTYKHLPAFVDSLRTNVNRSGAAFWDMYAAMGGHNSMAQWVKQVPPLAGPDYVHFTPKGAEKMGDMLFDTIILYYDYYKLTHYEE